MRVAIVTTAGVTRQFRQWPEAILGRALVARGHTVAAFTLFEEGSEITGQARDNVDGVAVHRLPVNKAWIAPGLIPALLRYRPQVVHLFHLRNALNWQAALLARLLHVPIVFTVVGPYHDPYLVDNRERPYAGKIYPRRLIYTPAQLALKLIQSRLRKPLSAWQNWCVHYPLRAADRLIALSRHEVGVLKRIGFDPHKIVQIPLWIDVPYIEAVPYDPPITNYELRITNNEVQTRNSEFVIRNFQSPHILFLGQLKERKGYDTLAEAMPIVLARGFPDALFLFAGQNPANASHLQEICARNGTLDQLVLLGKVSEEEKVRLMRAADCLVYPTRYESFGLPPLEAMAAGCPVVATDIPVVNEMIQHGENGLLVKREDPISLAEGIIRLLANPSLRASLVDGGKRTLHRYAEAPIVDKIERVYKRVMRDA